MLLIIVDLHLFNLCMLVGTVCGLQDLPEEHRTEEGGDAVICPAQSYVHRGRAASGLPRIQYIGSSHGL